MAETLSTDPQIRALQSSPQSPLVVEAVPLANPSHPLHCDTSTGTQRPLVPKAWRRVIFDSIHRLSQPGIRVTQKLITTRYVWPGINSDVRRLTRFCSPFDTLLCAVPMCKDTSYTISTFILVHSQSLFPNSSC